MAAQVNCCGNTKKSIDKKTGKNTTELIDKMMKLASRKFPYDKEKKRKNKG